MPPTCQERTQEAWACQRRRLPAPTGVVHPAWQVPLPWAQAPERPASRVQVRKVSARPPRVEVQRRKVSAQAQRRAEFPQHPRPPARARLLLPLLRKVSPRVARARRRRVSAQARQRLQALAPEQRWGVARPQRQVSVRRRKAAALLPWAWALPLMVAEWKPKVLAAWRRWAAEQPT
jgi:hypothetical protein